MTLFLHKASGGYTTYKRGKLDDNYTNCQRRNCTYVRMHIFTTHIGIYVLCVQRFFLLVAMAIAKA